MLFIDFDLGCVIRLVARLYIISAICTQWNSIGKFVFFLLFYIAESVLNISNFYIDNFCVMFKALTAVKILFICFYSL